MIIPKAPGRTLEDFYSVVGACIERLECLLEMPPGYEPNEDDRQAFAFLDERDKRQDLCEQVNARYALSA